MNLSCASLIYFYIYILLFIKIYLFDLKLT